MAIGASVSQFLTFQVGSRIQAEHADDLSYGSPDLAIISGRARADSRRLLVSEAMNFTTRPSSTTWAGVGGGGWLGGGRSVPQWF